VAAPAVFYFDLASPLAYLAAERILHVFSTPIQWEPVLAAELPGGHALSAFRCEREEAVARTEVERRAAALGLQPLRWPQPCPCDSALAMRAATYAKSIGRVVPFAQAAFRQAFAGGHDLGREEVVLIAAAACEMHPAAVLQGAATRAVRERLADATARAARLGVSEVPAVLADPGSAGERVLLGEEVLDLVVAA